MPKTDDGQKRWPRKPCYHVGTMVAPQGPAWDPLPPGALSKQRRVGARLLCARKEGRILRAELSPRSCWDEERSHGTHREKTGSKRDTSSRWEDRISRVLLTLSTFSTLRVFSSETAVLKGGTRNGPVPGSPVTLPGSGSACSSCTRRGCVPSL